MSALLWPLFLLALAAGFVFLELMLPSGGALSFLAAVSAIASVVVAFINGGPAVGTAWMGVACVVLPVVIALAVRWWPHTPFGRELFNIPDELADDQPDVTRDRLLGKHGFATTDMLPAGRVRVAGQTLDAVTEGMPIEQGDAIEVTLVEGNRIVVRPAGKTLDEPQPSTEESNNILSRPLDSLGLDGLDEPLS